MKYTKNAITQLKRQYKSVLLKCALINAALFMATTPAMAIISIGDYDSETNTTTISDDTTYEDFDYEVSYQTVVNQAHLTVNSISNFSATIENEDAGLISVNQIKNEDATLNNNGTIFAHDLQNSDAEIDNYGIIDHLNSFENTGKFKNNIGGLAVAASLDNKGKIDNNGNLSIKGVNNFKVFNNGIEGEDDDYLPINSELTAQTITNNGLFNNIGTIRLLNLSEPQTSTVNTAIYNSGTFLNGTNFDVEFETDEYEVLGDEEDAESSDWPVSNSITHTFYSAYSGSISGDIINRVSESADDSEDKDVASSDNSQVSALPNNNPIAQMISGGLFVNNAEIKNSNIYNDGNFYNGVEFSVTSFMPQLPETAEITDDESKSDERCPIAELSKAESTTEYWADIDAYISAKTIINGNGDGKFFSPYEMLATGLVNGGQIEAETIFNSSVLHNGEVNLLHAFVSPYYYYGEPILSQHIANVDYEDEEDYQAPEAVFFEGAQISAEKIYNAGMIVNAGTEWNEGIISADIINVNGGTGGIILANGIIEGNISSGDVSSEDIQKASDFMNRVLPPETSEDDNDYDESEETLGGSIIALSGDNEITGSAEAAKTYVMQGATLYIGDDVKVNTLGIGYPLPDYGNTSVEEEPALLDEDEYIESEDFGDEDFEDFEDDDYPDDVVEVAPSGLEIGGTLEAKEVNITEGATLTLGGDALIDELEVGYSKPKYYALTGTVETEVYEPSAEDAENTAPSRLDIGTNTANVNYAYFGAASTLALTVENEEIHGKLIAGEFDIEDGATLEVTVIPGLEKRDEPYEIQLLQETGEVPMKVRDGWETADMNEEYNESTGFNNFRDKFIDKSVEDEEGEEIEQDEETGIFQNNAYEIKRVDDNGLYSFKKLVTAQEIIVGPDPDPEPEVNPDSDSKKGSEPGVDLLPSPAPISPEPVPSNRTFELGQMAKAWLDEGLMQSPAGVDMQDGLNKIYQHSNNVRQELGAALEALAPNNAPVSQAVATAIMGRIFGGIGTHLNKPKSGLASGDALNGVSAWGSIYYGNSKLHDHAGAYGFDTDSKGITAGVDRQITSSVKLGFGLQYDESKVSAYKRDVDVDTTAVFGYGEYRPSNWYLSGIAAYGRSDYDEKKFSTQTVMAHYKADLVGLQALTGYDMASNFADISPNIGLRYNYIKRHSYNDGANQDISGNNSDILTGVVGLKAAKSFGGFRPSVYVNLTYDVISDKDNATVNLTNGSRYSIGGKRLNRFGAEAGAALEYNCHNWDVIANYDYSGRKHFNSHSGMLTVKYHF